MPRTALGLIIAGMAAELATLILVLGDATLPGRMAPHFAAMIAGGGGLLLTVGLCLLEGRRRPQF
jgi:hypothetical protein